ncbi:MAG TPA: fatty acyl-AMP ligase, partial [Gemmatimonadaceae bacterium]|nr:fatty acyl-AMP ligase [Gemmatimonadaceae bacterium]
MRALFATLERWADRHADKLLYSFLDTNGDEVERHSYGTFLARIDLIARHLGGRRQFQAGDRVLLIYPPGLEMIAALFACARVGLIPVPVPPPSAHGPSATWHRLRHVARDCAAVAVLTSHDCQVTLRRRINANGETVDAVDAGMLTRATWIVTDDLLVADGPAPVGAPGNVFLLQYTSGSTSDPRGVVVTHANVLHNCGLAVDHEAPVTVSWLPQHHDMGLLGYYIYVALTGGTTYGFSPSSFIQRPALWLETITKHRATASSAPNFAYEHCLRNGRLPESTLAALDLSSLRYLMAAAEPIRPDTYRRFLQKFARHGLRPESFFVAYGLAENTLAVTNYGRSTLSVSKRKLAHGTARLTRNVSGVGVAAHLMSCGKPLAGNIVRIVHPERRVGLDDDEVGEIWIRGASKSPGYWNDPASTRQLFHARIADEADDDGEYLRTGDMGFFHDGELYVCGRRKDMIIVRGRNLFPQDIEAVVERASPLVRPGGVAAFELDDDGRAPVGIVAEVSNRNAMPDARAIAAAIRDDLGIGVGLVAFVAPKAVPRTSSGKIMRYRVKQMCLAGEMKVLWQFVQKSSGGEKGDLHDSTLSPLAALKARYQLTG